MKKLVLLLAVVGFAAVSCKKDYTCKCVSKENGVVDGTYESTAKMKKKDAETWCDQGNSTTSYSFGGITYTSEVTCTLE